jgi:hypothetical protein
VSVRLIVSREDVADSGSTRTRISYASMITRRGVPIVRHTFSRPGTYVVTDSEKSMGSPGAHSSIQVTVDVYGHLIPGANRQAVDRLDDVTGRNPRATKRPAVIESQKHDTSAGPGLALVGWFRKGSKHKTSTATPGDHRAVSSSNHDILINSRATKGCDVGRASLQELIASAEIGLTSGMPLKTRSIRGKAVKDRDDCEIVFLGFCGISRSLYFIVTP